MKLKIILAAILVTFTSTRVNAQDGSKTEIQASIGKGGGTAYSDFRQDDHAGSRLELWSGDLNLINDNLNINFQANMESNALELKISANTHSFRIGPIRSGGGFSATHFSASENLFTSKDLSIESRTLRQFAAFKLDIGIGKLNKDYIRIGLVAGGVRIRDDAFYKVHGNLTNSGNTVYNEDALVVLGSEISASFLPFKKIKLGLNGQKFNSQNNRQGLISDHYSHLQGKIYIFPMNRVGISAQYRMSSNPIETFSFNELLLVNLVVRLKAP